MSGDVHVKLTEKIGLAVHEIPDFSTVCARKQELKMPIWRTVLRLSAELHDLGDARLRVTAHSEDGYAAYPVTRAGRPVGDCPDCGADLRVLKRGGLLVGCDAYPDCEVSYSLPHGTVVGDCSCGLPVFELASGRRCLDSSCDHHE